MINGISDTTTFAAQQALGGAQTTAAGAPAPSLLGSVASLLGMSTDDLITTLKGGTSMSDLASQKGVSRDDLLAAITQGLQNSQNAASQPTDIATLAAKIADQKGLPGHHRHHPGAGASSGEADLQQKVADLSAALGMSSDQLVSALQSGLAASGSAPGYGVSASLLQGLQFDQLA
jgi:lambda repressor-like predicted transcriptional regulator